MSRERQQECLDNIESSMEVLKKYLEENIALKKSKEDIPVTGMAVLRQQYTLAEAIEEWIASLKKEILSLIHISQSFRELGKSFCRRGGYFQAKSNASSYFSP